jgi:hypothetical protein
MCRVAGEVANGLLVHPYHSLKYLDEIVRPAVVEGERRAGRPSGAVAFSVTSFIVPEPAWADSVRSQIAFYASTPTYRPVMDLHGWGTAATALSELARRGDWAEMGAQITDAMLEVFAVVAPWPELAVELRRRYGGLARRLAVYVPYRLGERDAFWRGLASGLAAEP